VSFASLRSTNDVREYHQKNLANWGWLSHSSEFQRLDKTQVEWSTKAPVACVFQQRWDLNSLKLGYSAGSQTITPTASSSSIRSTHSALEVVEDVPGVRLTDAVRRMCVALLKENANIYLANHQHITPYAKSLLRPEIHILFENYNPGTKVWKYRITSLEIGELIGSGAFGEVYLAKLHGSEFAVKMIELAEASKHEAGIMTDIRHPNILTFVGMYLPPAGAGDKVGLVTEYLPMGSLSNYLGFFKDRSPAPTTISWPMMMRIALTVARGMAWLLS